MSNNVLPTYLALHLTQSIGEPNPYSLRNADHLSYSTIFKFVLNYAIICVLTLQICNKVQTCKKFN